MEIPRNGSVKTVVEYIQQVVDRCVGVLFSENEGIGSHLHRALKNVSGAGFA
jgi:hypothetical protein